MTVNKLTYPAKENAVQEKINEIIDNLGNTIPIASNGSYVPANGETVRYRYANARSYNIFVGDGSSSIDTLNDANKRYLSSYNLGSVGAITLSYSSSGDTLNITLNYDTDTLALKSGTPQKLSVKTATSSTLGIVKPDNSTITIDANGVISAVTGSSGANTDLSNLSATGEAHFLKPTITQDVTLGDSNTYNITVKAYNSNLDMNVACLQLYSSNNTLYVGNNGTTLGLRGDTTRPQYNGDDLALYNDLSSKANTDLSNVTTITNSLTSTAINPLINKLTSADITVAPSADIDTGLLFKDNNNNNIAGFTTTRFANGTQATSISAINNISGTSKTAYLNVYVDGSGNDHADASSGVKSTIANWAMPASTSYPVAFDASGYFTASQNGYLVVSIRTNSPSGFYLTTSSMAVAYTVPYANWDANGFIPLAAGQTVALFINDGYLNTGFPKFVPCIGG